MTAETAEPKRRTASISNQFGVVAAVATAVAAAFVLVVSSALGDAASLTILLLSVAAGLAVGLICRWYASRWTNRLNCLVKAIDALSAGDYQSDFETPAATDELAMVSERFRLMRDRLYSHQRGLKHRARRDRLTGLFNREYLEQQLPGFESWVLDQESEMSLILVDLDNFKQWNDSLGHAAGDKALQVVAESLQSVCRTTDLVARLGGDEFVVVVPGLDLIGATSLAERLRYRIRDALAAKSAEEFGTTIEAREQMGVAAITTSIGVAAYNGNLNLMMEHADSALYEAKRQGRDQVKVYTESRAVA